MDDSAIPVCNDVTNLKDNRSQWAKRKYVVCLAFAAVLTVCTWALFQMAGLVPDRQSLSSISKRSVAEECPRLIIHPLPPNDTDSTLIWYRSYDSNTYKGWVDELNKFIEVYRNASMENVVKCGFDYPPRQGTVCDVDVRSLSLEQNFQYHRTAPSIILNLSNLGGWKPEFYNKTNELPDRMPADLKQYILEVKSAQRLNMVWISCDGENAADRENIGPVNYYPARGFPGYYYPYENTAGYLSPLVAVKFERPANGVLISIKCKAWAKNLHNGDSKHGIANLELMIN